MVSHDNTRTKREKCPIKARSVQNKLCKARSVQNKLCKSRSVKNEMFDVLVLAVPLLTPKKISVLLNYAACKEKVLYQMTYLVTKNY